MRKMLFSLIRLLEREERKRLHRLIVLCLLNPIIDLFGISMLLPILNQAVAQPGSPAVMLEVAGLGLLFVCKTVFELLKSRQARALSSESAHKWSVKIYELYSKEPLQEHNRKSAIQAIAGVRGDVAVCANIIVTSMNLISDGLTIIGSFVVFIYIAQWLGIATCVVVAAFMALLHWRSSKNMAEYGKAKRQLEIRANGMTSTAFGAYKEIKIDANKQNMLDKFEAASATCAKVQRDYEFSVEMFSILLQNALQILLILVLAVVVALRIDLTGIVAQAAVYLTILVRMIPGTKSMITALNTVQYGRKYCEVLQENLARFARLKEDEAQAQVLRERPVTLKKGIRVEGLTFGYDGGRQIFRDASLEIRSGESTAIIGPSGAGKTTFLDLILGLLQPQAGHIWYDDFDIVDGKDAAGPCRVDLGQIVSYIPQTVYLNGETIRNNIVFMAEEDDEKRIRECLQCAQIWEDVAAMPDGMDTMIGQNGTTVSGGQRQRIALARALYKDFEILIMDEATAALDMETEKAVIDSIRQIKGGKTLLMVTHHLSLANECENVFKIENQTMMRVR